MSIDISFLVPSRGRPHRLKKYIDSIIKTAKVPECIEINCYIDDNDTMLSRYREVKYPNTNLFIESQTSVSKAWNFLSKKAMGNIFIMGNDDIVFRTLKWDRMLKDEIAKYKDQIYCIWFNDLINSEHHCAFPIISRKWVDVVGYYLPECFEFSHNDTWLYDIAKRIDRCCYMEDVIAEHEHVGQKKAHGQDI